MGMLESIAGGKFTIVVEFTPHSKDEVKHIAKIAAGMPALNEKYTKHGIVFAGVSLTQNPDGNLSYDHQAWLSILKEQGLPESLEVCPHVTGKDMNADSVLALLTSLYEHGVRHILAWTGDSAKTAKEGSAHGALGLLELVKAFNIELLRKCKTPEAFASAPLLHAGASVSPFERAEASFATQLTEAPKKVARGAAFLACRAGWDADRSEALIRELKNVGVPILGDVRVVAASEAGRMQTLPGCVLPERFIEVLAKEKPEDALSRAGQQLAMFRALGYAGVTLGNPGEFGDIKEIEKVVDTALGLGDWRSFKSNLTFPMPPLAAAPVKSAAVEEGASPDETAKSNPLKGSGLVQIAELIHASIPLPGAAMKFMQKMGEEGFTKPNRGLLIIEDLISSQARQGADYIDVNLDALGDPNAPELMRRFVRLVHNYGEGIPPCIDSSDVRVLQAGLEEWNRLEGKRPPLVNSVPFMELEKYRPLLDLRKRYAFSVICLLVGAEGPLKSTAEMVSAAREMFRAATAAGFRNNEILFDSVTLGIASDGCMDPMGNLKPSHTHNSFHAIREMRQDPAMPGVHCVLGVSNWVYGARKRRIGHIRAFIAAAQKYGLDAAIVDVGQQYGIAPAPPELVAFVETFVALDGSEDSMMTYSAAMQQARQANWI